MFMSLGAQFIHPQFNKKLTVFTIHLVVYIHHSKLYRPWKCNGVLRKQIVIGAVIINKWNLFLAPCLEVDFSGQNKLKNIQGNKETPACTQGWNE